jgi:hypothetical protein
MPRSLEIRTHCVNTSTKNKTGELIADCQIADCRLIALPIADCQLPIAD